MSIDRKFVSAVEPPAEASGPAWWCLFVEDRLVVREAGAAAELPHATDPADLGLAPVSRHYLGTLAGHDCYAADLAPDAPLPAGLAAQALRGLYGRLPDDLFALAGRASQIVTWDSTHRFCGRCGAPTEPLPGERARKCPTCGLTAYPRLSPAVIVLVARGAEVLLARGRNFPAAFYSVLAGFVEPGESLEEAVAREVHEEVGLEVKDLRYFGSQPWPYPHQLMIGFTAAYAGGELRIDERELADAAWFTAEGLPRVPPKLSIARRLIDWFVAEQSRAQTGSTPTA
ncbi:MAG: NAD(+) diphosphatase [Chloroflexota bacterium]|nr:NAD(+) diphosphatase [Chloroflexota bacterium]